MNRKLLPNEVQLDIAGKTKEELLQEAIRTIDNYEPVIEYDYELPDKREFLSWVQSRKLF